MKVSLLGPMEIAFGAKAIRLQRPRQRALFAILALYANKTVNTDAIIDMMWADAPPAAARNQIQVHVSHIRKALRIAGTPDVLETQPAGYLLRLAPAGSDVGMFTALESVGHTALGEHRYRAAAEAFRLALRTWRGPPLAGVDAAFVACEAPLLEERRRTVFRRWTDLQIGLDRCESLLPSLFAAVQREPLDEGLCLRLMAALQRVGRSADALAACRQSKRLLHRELGIDPHESLRAAERTILRGLPIDHPEWRFLELEPALSA